MKAEVRCENQEDNIYTLCGVDKNGKTLCVITHYSEDDNTKNKEISVDFGKNSQYEIYLLDDKHDGELVETTDNLSFDMKVHSCILIKEV